MTLQNGAYALRAGLERLYARMRMHTLTRPSTHMHARMHNHAHPDQYVTLTAFPRQQWFRESAPLLRYTYIVCLVLLVLPHSTVMLRGPKVFRICKCANYNFYVT